MRRWNPSHTWKIGKQAASTWIETFFGDSSHERFSLWIRVDSSWNLQVQVLRCCKNKPCAWNLPEDDVNVIKIYQIDIPLKTKSDQDVSESIYCIQFTYI